MSQILIVDDDTDILDVMVKALKDAKLDVHSVASGRGAMAMMLANSYKLLITDLILDDISGFDVIDKAIAKDETIKILVISGGGGGDNTEELLSEAILSGADAVLEKPFSPGELVRSAVALLRLTS